MTRAALARGVRLEVVTIAWNAGEVFVTVGLGIAANSLALVAFGLDSLVEIFASVVVLVHLRDPERTDTRRAARALRRVGLAFVALAVVLAASATTRLALGSRPDESPIGIGYLAATIVVMLLLARGKAAVGRSLGDHPLAAEARMTLLDAALASAVLAALALEVIGGWWWADPLAALAVATVALAEGREHLGIARSGS